MITYRNNYRYVYISIHGLRYRHISLLCQMTVSSNSDIPVTWSYLASRSCPLTPFSSKKNQGSLEKWMILVLRQDIKVCLEILIVPGSKGVLKTQTTPLHWWKHIEETQRPTERSPNFGLQYKIEKKYP